MRLRFFLRFLAVMLCGATFAASASAEETWGPMLLTNRLELYSQRVIDDSNTLTFNPVSLRAQAAIHELLLLDVQASMVVGYLDDFRAASSSLGQVQLGNVTAGARVVLMHTDHAVLTAGASLTVPTLPSLAKGNSNPFLLLAASFASAGLDIHEYMPLTTFVRAPVDFEARWGSVIRFRSELVPVFWIMRENLPDRAAFVLEHWDELFVLGDDGFYAGVRLQAVLASKQLQVISGLTFHDVSGFAVLPFVGYEPKNGGASLRLSLLIPIEAREQMIAGKWGARIQVGSVF